MRYSIQKSLPLTDNIIFKTFQIDLALYGVKNQQLTDIVNHLLDLPSSHSSFVFAVRRNPKVISIDHVNCNSS